MFVWNPHKKVAHLQIKNIWSLKVLQIFKLQITRQFSRTQNFLILKKFGFFCNQKCNTLLCLSFLCFLDGDQQIPSSFLLTFRLLWTVYQFCFEVAIQNKRTWRCKVTSKLVESQCLSLYFGLPSYHQYSPFLVQFAFFSLALFNSFFLEKFAKFPLNSFLFLLFSYFPLWAFKASES